MRDFLQYILGEVKSERLSKTDALGLIRQFGMPIVLGQTQSQSQSQSASPHSQLQQNMSDLSEQIKGLETQEYSPQAVLEEASALMTFEEVWQEQELTAVANSVGIKTILCFLSHQENQQAMIEAAHTLDYQTRFIFISQNTTNQKQSPHIYQILCGDRNSYEMTFQNIKENYGKIDGILYLWPLEDSSCIKDYSCIVYILQSIAAVKLKINRVLLVGQFNNGLERCYLESWIGFERSLKLIMPNTQLAVICKNTEKQHQQVVMKEWLTRLWGELQTAKVESVLYQDGKRQVCRVRPITITTGDSPVRTGGTYLITGGCGGLGLLFAGHFAKTQPVNLILAGRSLLDAEKQAKIRNLEKLGSRVWYLQADVSDVTGMKRGLDQAKKLFGSIHGVIHAAGLQDHQSILQKDIQSFEKVLTPKIKGTLVLDELLIQEPLDFVCYFSSFSPILGDFGACNYSIANRFLMAFAHYRDMVQQQGLRSGKTIVVNWPIWKAGGMAADNDDNIKMLLESSGQRFLEDVEGLAVFDRILAQHKIQVLVAAGQPSRVHRFLGLTTENHVTLATAASGSQGNGRRIEMKGFSVEQCLEWDLKEQISKLLKIPHVKLEQKANLASFGFNSINLTRFAIALTNHYGLEITPSVFYGYPTIQKLTQYFLQEHHTVIWDFYRDDMVAKSILTKKSLAEAVPERPEFVKTEFAIKSNSPDVGEPIAIIGMSGRFPNARNIDEMWQIIADGREVVQEIPADRFDWRQYYGDPGKETGKINSKWCGCIPGVSEFDPLFFEISPKEAEMMDPRQRLMLQEAWRALEDAGYGTKQLSMNKIGMFVGVEMGDYQLLAREWGNIASNLNSVLAARLAYFLNLNGPVMAIDTACSSGLVATHQAILSLHNHECDTAIAAGVNLFLAPDAYVMMSQAGMLSPDGRCYTFDQRANGMVPGEGVAVVVLKRLSQAQADNDPIYAVIRGSGINYDGKSNGITAPNGVAQTSLIKTVYDQYQVNAEEIEYIVAHGTGTKLGDPIEVNALHDAFKSYTQKQGYCALTSTKPNFGHTFSPSGIISLISLVQAFRHDTIPASLHCEQENDYINWKNSPFYVNKMNKPWLRHHGKNRTGAVSAFGMSGTNVHMVVQSYDQAEDEGCRDYPPYYLLAFSAKTQEVLLEKLNDLLAVLDNNNLHQQALLNISYTLLEGRQHFNYRYAMVVQDCEEAVYILKQAISNEKLPSFFQGKVLRDFNGQKALVQFLEDLLKQSQSLLNDKTKYCETLYALADLYCQGYEINGSKLYGDIKPHRIHLPTYPFARECYWIPESQAKIKQSRKTAGVNVSIHRLLQKKNSDLSEQRFSSTVTALTREEDLLEVASAYETLLLLPCWQEKNIVSETATPDYAQHLVVLCEFGAISREKIESRIKKVRCLNLQSLQTGVAERFQDYAIEVFEEIKNLLANQPKGRILVQLVLMNQEEGQLFAGLFGILKTAQLENPKLTGQLIEVKPGEDVETIIKKLEDNRQNPLDKHIRYQDGKRWLSGWSEMAAPEDVDIPWKKKGVYLITGGVGGLGSIFAREIIEKVHEATLILTGRSPLGEKKQAQLRELEALGAHIEYKQVDVGQKKAVDCLIQSIREDFGGLQGIIHSAGVIQDNYILKKTRQELCQVLAPKVAGLVNLDQASKDLALDFFILFSSGAASLGNPGQADYSAANAFMDAYAVYRNELVLSNQRQGKTLAVNWPLWKEGGMRVDVATQKMMREKTGIIAMRTVTGIQALYQALASGKDQVMVLEGDASRVRRQLLNPQASYAALPTEKSVLPIEELRQKTIHQLKILFGEFAKLDVRKIDADEPLETYGIDSIMITQLNQKIAGVFGELSTTLFYEYQTLGDLAEYFIADCPQKCMQWIGLEDKVQTMPDIPSRRLSFNDQLPVVTSWKAIKKQSRSFSVTDPGQGTREPIAIIGMSGRYPQAKNLKEYWENLVSGKDCITEIPEERWSLEGFYHSDQQEAVDQGKSYSKWGGFVEGFADFDPLFFNISPREALNMDPQERLFIESCWEVLEDAGYTREQLATRYNQKIGVFAGITKTGFDLYCPDLWKQGEKFFPHTSFGSVANRVSYLLNLQGPSMPIDTMCSSSLTAIHEACEHLHQGACKMAIAGGVNLYLHPSNYIALCAYQMLSEDGKCKSFGKGGNGFVPGEGVGTILLKRLSQAIADQDHIYAVIRGTNINHGGKTNGYTVPNPSAQGELIQDALEKAGVDARTVSYIEAHGTGTELGDPIEITGLTQAFQKKSQDTAYCEIGSVKSNIGHLEAAAGIAGVAKIVLQMKHQKIVPSLHAQELNPNINFAKTPFIVRQTLTDWKRPVVSIHGETKEYSRRAGISSFGAGGANAHVVLEEYITEDTEQPQFLISAHNPAIIVLSAKNEERLKVQAGQLLTEIKEQVFSDSDLADIAYTLQVGREAMEERLAIIVRSLKELEEKLEDFVKNQKDIAGLYWGQVKRNKEALAVFTEDDELREAIEKWIERKKYGKILDLWVKGLVVDWSKLYGDIKPRRIHLPTYPFARERYWIPQSQVKTKQAEATVGVNASIHPLLQQNTSDLSEQRFSSTFTGREFFLADHVVQGRRILPGVAYLEMARAAVVESAGILQQDRTGIQLKNVVWSRPIVVEDQPVQIHIGVFPEENGEIAYEVYSLPEADTAETVIHSQGRAVFCRVKEVPALDVLAIKARCTQNTLQSSQCYEAFQKMGIHYGPGHQGIEQVYAESGQVLAKLSLPTSLADTTEQFVLHPSLLDAALQSAIGLMLDSNTQSTASLAVSQPLLPFALQELEIISKCTPVMWALIRYSEGSTAADKVQKLDLDICDEAGSVCVRMKAYTSRALTGEADLLEAASAYETLLLQPCWKEKAIVDETATPEYAQHLVVLCELGAISREKIESRIKKVRCLNLQSLQTGVAERFQDYAIEVFEELKNLLANQPKGRILVQLVLMNQEEGQLFAGLLGILKTAQLENPKLTGQLIEVKPGEDVETIIKKLEDNRQNPLDKHIRYQDGKRWLSGWSEMAAPEDVDIPWKKRGVYLITGGAGGLGLIFAREIIEKVQEATLILTGRSPLGEKKQAQLRELEALGARIEYKQVDVSQKKAVDCLIQSIREDFGGLQGIIHSAGVIQDNYILKKTRQELCQVLAPKVAGLVNLDEASKDLALDFFILFSSGAASLGNPGQADYSAANAFMDAYAVYRNELVLSNQRQGKTLAVNWPLWKEGGMRVDAATQKMMREKTGIIAMRTATGIRALYQALAASKDQVMVLEGDVDKIKEKILSGESLRQATEEVAGFNDDSLLDKVQTAVRQFAAELIKVRLEDIDIDTELSEYGFDSIILTEFSNKLNQKYHLELTPTIFFENPTLGCLAKYLSEEYTSEFGGQIAIPISNANPAPTIEDEVEERQFNTRRRSRFAGNLALPALAAATNRLEPVAIVGISGIFPMARNLDEFWDNLVEGKDCISEIPENRWDWRQYYGDPRQEINKTNIKWGGFIDGIDEFDPLFFGISPREAELMDPQQRLMMIYIWKAIEDAGISAQSLSGTNTAIFVGTINSGYSELLAKANTAIEGYTVTGLNPSVGPNRMSYFLNLHGPSEPIETACSSSLVAIHRAVSNIQNGNCEMAIVGGVNTIVTPEPYISFSKAGMLCEDGRCKTFSEEANGYVRGEGAGMIFLKKLKDAEQAGDHIYGIIRGTAVNHGGRATSLTAPNPKAQTELLITAYTKAGIDPRSVGYIETMGTGSKLGDPIEINGLRTAFKELYQAAGDTQAVKAHCGLGSVKTNIGHLEISSGIAGVIKVLLQLKNKILVKSLNCDPINPYIKLEGSPFYIVKEKMEWKSLQDTECKDLPRRAGVSSFGFGGVNAHVIIEEYVPKLARIDLPALPDKNNPILFVLSAKSEQQLKIYAGQMKEFIASQEEVNLAEMAYTLQVGREAMEYRLAFLADSRENILNNLDGFVENNSPAGVLTAQVKKSKNQIAVYEEDDDARALVQNWLYKKKLRILAELWVKGLYLDWNELYGMRKPRRIILPGYPFARERYWVTADRGTIAVSLNGAGGSNHGGSTLLTGINSPAITEVVLTGKGSNEDYTGVEKVVAEVWGRELGLRKINIYESFFELGGNSLITVKLEVEMRNRGLLIDVSDINKYPSVFEIASFISQSTNNPNSQKILDNIEPFNDIYYRSCFYNALFPVIRHLNKDCTPFLVNDVPIYTCVPDKEAIWLTVDYRSNKALEQLFHEQNITVSTKLSSNSITNDVIFSISQNRPVIIVIDCYYALVREDLYQKEHWPHFWLVYGYDAVKKVFNIIEHRHRGSLSYKKYEVSYQELENSYKGYLENFHKGSNEPTFYAFYLKNSNNCPDENLDEQYKKILAANLINNKQDILQGLERIKLFAESFREFAARHESMENNMDDILNMFNGIINARKSDMYKVGLLFKENSDINGSLDKVIKNWDFIRLKLARCMYTSTYDRGSLEIVLEKLAHMYEYEEEYQRLLISHVENLNM